MAARISGTLAASGVCYNDQYRMPCKLKGIHCMALNCIPQKAKVRKCMNGYQPAFRFCENEKNGQTTGQSNGSLIQQVQNVRCYSYGSRNSSETKECSLEDDTDPYRDFEEHSRGTSQFADNQVAAQKKSVKSSQGLAEACKFVYNDAKFVNERAQNDILLLSRGITRLDKRARKDVAVLGSGFLKLDARARKDTQKIDHSVKERAARLTHFARILKEQAQSDLKKAADQHWSDGALEADLRRADLVVRRRAMEDAFMALKFVRDIHDMMANRLQEQFVKDGSSSANSTSFITLEKNGNTFELFPREVSTDQIAAIEEAYWSMASALSEADGIDYTDPEELELKALANALAAAPSMWILGNAGMGALQRLAQDSNYAVSRAAARAIDELTKQWELEEGDSLRFVWNQNVASKDTADDSPSADDTRA
uniref:Senescence domain-containing protein n=2 Tax=Leersia perrieri TaxID=77586 RepID=A0A0D9WCU0_9ORYZ